MNFTSKTVFALFALSLNGAAGQMSFGGKKGGSSSMSVDDDKLDLVCEVPSIDIPTCEDPAEGSNGLILDCNTNIRRSGYYYFNNNIQCQPGDSNTAISIGARRNRQINGVVVVDCKGYTIDGMMNSQRAFGGLRADQVILKNCGIQNFGASGIGNTRSMGPNLVVDNVVSIGNGNKGININARRGFDSVSISNSKFDSNSREGARIESQRSGSTVTIFDTTFNANGEDGLRGEGLRKVYTLADVEANENGENGIEIDGSRNRIVISGSETNRNGQRGIAVGGSRNSIDFSRSEACGNDSLENDLNNSDIRIPRGPNSVGSEGVTCDDARPGRICECSCPVETPAPAASISGGKKGGSGPSS